MESRDGNKTGHKRFRYLIPIPIKKIHHHPHARPNRYQTFVSSPQGNGYMLELIDELILLVTNLKYYDGPNCDLIKFKDLLVIIM